MCAYSIFENDYVKKIAQINKKILELQKTF